MCPSVDWLDDVELACVRFGSGSLGDFIRWFPANAHAQCNVGPDGPAGVSCQDSHAHKRTHARAHKRTAQADGGERRTLIWMLDNAAKLKKK